MEYVDGDSTDRLALIVGVSVGAVALAIVITVVVVCCVKRRRNKTTEKCAETEYAGKKLKQNGDVMTSHVGKQTKEEKYYAQMMSNTELPSLRTAKDAPRKKRNTYVDEPNKKVRNKPVKDSSAPAADNMAAAEKAANEKTTDFRLSQNVFIMNDENAKNTKKNKKSKDAKKKNKTTVAKQNDVDVTAFSNAQLPKLRKSKVAENTKQDDTPKSDQLSQRVGLDSRANRQPKEANSYLQMAAAADDDGTTAGEDSGYSNPWYSPQARYLDMVNEASATSQRSSSTDYYYNAAFSHRESDGGLYEQPLNRGGHTMNTGFA